MHDQVMPPADSPPRGRAPRADAARNAERILESARLAFAQDGPQVRLEEIAKRAGVGVATLYRHYPRKEDLITAIFNWQYEEKVGPVVRRARTDDDPWRALVMLLEAGLEMAEQEANIFAAAKETGSLLAGLASEFFGTIATVVQRGQEAGLVRADLDADDLPRLVFMLVSTIRLTPEPSGGWRRYLALMLDALRPAAATDLPPAPKLWFSPYHPPADGCS
ncbi:TetR/AcrR family transcriptional regulator [Fodinicola feengrottensis]|uniref:TetR/AcrR family transcriptional regulator n=1 Tax=Fodinicola feengrottensis TaxID=435914 RepID=A0ABN2HBV7_9ACTN|nr:TetR/AcrR family transcriptional regulator [Fodinicola feengrottensis]